MPEEGTNTRRVKCNYCKRSLEKGEGIKHDYVFFNGNGQHYYLCPTCEEKRKAWIKRREEEDERKRDQGHSG